MTPLNYVDTIIYCHNSEGKLVRRKYKRRLTKQARECIQVCRAYTGWGYIRIARYLQINPSTVSRVIYGNES